MSQIKSKSGRKPATPQQKADYEKWSKERIRITNLISRNKNIKKVCCICGKKGQILHNRYDPYYISFICKECRKDPNNLMKATEYRFDVRTLFGTAYKYTSHFTDEMVKKYVLDYLNDSIKSIGSYCKDIGITRYQFNKLIERYDKLFPEQQIKLLIKNRSHRVQKEECIQRVENRNLI